METGSNERFEGKVLELGVGTGKNIEYYPEGIDITAIDFSEKMLERAREKVMMLNKEVNLIHMNTQDIPTCLILVSCIGYYSHYNQSFSFISYIN